MTHPASDPEIPEFTLPDGTLHNRLFFGELLSFEREQGGYRVDGDGWKLFVRVIPAHEFTIRFHIRRHRLMHKRERDGKPGSIADCKASACTYVTRDLEITMVKQDAA